MSSLCSLCFWFGAAHAADRCEALNGTYQYESTAARINGVHDYLSNFIHFKEAQKLVKREGGGPTSLAGGGTMARPKATFLAKTATLTWAVTGPKLKFLDAEGKVLGDNPMNYPDKWTCKGARLERRADRTTGLGNALHTERVEETFSKDAASGDLVYTETVTVVDPPGGQPKKSESRFKLARSTG